MGKYQRLYYSTWIDMKYPRITISTNSSEDFTAEMKIFLDHQSATTEGAYGFPFKIEAKKPKRFEIKLRKNISVLKNGKHNLEEYFNITGPMNSIQQVSTQKTRINFTSRLFWTPTVAPDGEYIHINWIPPSALFGITKNKFIYVDTSVNKISEISYSETVRYRINSCCSKTMSFYVLHYDPTLVNSLSVRVMDIVHSKTNKKITKLKSYSVSYIDSLMIPNIQVVSSKQFLKSVANGTVALCLHDQHLVKLLMIDYIDKDHPVVTPIGSISSKSLGREAEFSKVDIISMMSETPELRTILVVLGTASHIFTQYIHYDPSMRHPKLKTLPTIWNDQTSTTITLNSSMVYINCETTIITKYKNNQTKASSRCMVVLNNYLMKSLVYEADILNLSISKGKQNYILSTPSYRFEHEYEIPRFFEVISDRVSPDFIAVHAVSTLDYHHEILVYKRGWREVWCSAYSSYEDTVSYDLGIFTDGTSWLYVNEYQTNIKAYLVGNMTMEVEEGYNMSESLSLAYSTFGRPSEVESFSQEFTFSENLVRKSSLFLFVYGSVGGFFGVVVIIWCCYCCIFR